MTNTSNQQPKLKFLPLAGQIMVEEVEADGVTKSGIILPERMAKPSNQGRIVAVGDEVPCATNNTVEEPQRGNAGRYEAFRIGNTIVWPKHLESRISFDQKKFYMIVNYTDVILSDFGYFCNIAND